MWKTEHRQVPEQRGVSRLRFVPAEGGRHLQEKLGQAVLVVTVLCSGAAVLEGLQSRVALGGQEAQLAARPPPGLGRDVQLGEQQRPQGAGGASKPGVFGHAAPRRGARGGAGRVVRGGRAAGEGVGAGVTSLPAGRRGPGGRPAGREVRRWVGWKLERERERKGRRGREEAGRHACTWRRAGGAASSPPSRWCGATGRATGGATAPG